MANKFYWESVGECVSQVYEIKDAKDWDDAKRLAFDEMAEGDHIAECSEDAIIYSGDYAKISEDKCESYATLQKGTWANTTKTNEEYWEEYAWWFDDNPETFYNGNFQSFTEWEDGTSEEA